MSERIATDEQLNVVGKLQPWQSAVLKLYLLNESKAEQLATIAKHDSAQFIEEVLRGAGFDPATHGINNTIFIVELPKPVAPNTPASPAPEPTPAA